MSISTIHGKSSRKASFATADRQKKVAITAAEQEAEQALVKGIKAAEAAKKAAELKTEQDRFTAVRAADAAKEAAERKAQEVLIEAEAAEAAAKKQAVAKRVLAEAHTAETAAEGLAEAQVLEAKAVATQKQGSAEATVMQQKFAAEAKGITEKAEAMKLFDGVGREHEEFKLRLNKDKDVELAQIHIQKDIAQSQASVVAEALKNAKIDIGGGETQFFEKITNAIANGKAFDRWIQNSETLSDVKETFFNGDPDYFHAQMRGFVDRFGLTSEDVKNLSVAAALGQMITLGDDSKTKGLLTGLLSQAQRLGVADRPVTSLTGKDGKAKVA
ncbi:MAG: hypothetical protein FJ403_13220 [Verrucomicrobia bacterium]|nr:hypothetical protein [Verrucomicrobiota bacterium]